MIKHINMKKLLLFSLLLTVFLSSVFSAEPASYHQDRLLICLKPDINVGELSRSAGVPVTGIANLDQLMALREIVAMEKYLPAATADDIVGDIHLANIYRLTIKPGTGSVDQLIKDFNAEDNILYSEYDVINRPSYIPNDPEYSKQWYMRKIGSQEIWDLWDIQSGLQPGSRNIVLASVDSGVQYTHPDLWQNAWINQAEVPAGIFSAVDTDSDGYVSAVEVVAHLQQDHNSDGKIDLQDALHTSSPFMDGVDGDDWDNNATSFIDDLLGWDISGATSTNDPDNDPMGAILGAAPISNLMHGTHVAGLLSATTDNNVGIASTIYNGSLMSVKCLYDQDSDGYISGGYSGLLYAAKAGADIINLSWGGISYSSSNQAIIDLVYDTYGSLVIAAAGNGDDSGNPLDTPHYPSGYNKVVSVTALSSSDIFSWANYGDDDLSNPDKPFYGVDISAPGEGIHSTVFTTDGSYQSWAGTSMAAPIVASSFGLLKSVHPDQSNAWLIETMLSTADSIDHINPDFAGQLGVGRINIDKAVSKFIIPRLSFEAYSIEVINEGGDGQLSAGEEAILGVSLLNSSSLIDALGVSAILRSESPYVTISDSVGVFGDISIGETIEDTLDLFQFSISLETPSGSLPFTLSIEANQGSEYPYFKTLEFEVETGMRQINFPITTASIRSGTAIIDIDKKEGKEIIFGGYDGFVHAITSDGTELAGFPASVGSRVEATPAIGDIDNDGDVEIVVGSLDNNIYVIQHDGSVASIYTSASYMWATSTLYDLDNDGDLEIITPSFDKTLTVLHHDGSPYPNFPLTLEGQMTSGAAVADINRDGNINIVVATWGKMLHAFNLDGTEVSGFPVTLLDAVRSAPVLANMDGSSDGKLDILFGSNDNSFHAYDASGVELWSFSSNGQDVQADAAVCDLDNDGDMEIIFGGLDRNIYALDHTGALLPGWPIVTGGEIYSSPAIADVDGDGLAEIFIGSMDRQLYGLHLDGSNVSGFPSELLDRAQGAISAMDIDRDNDVEIVIGTDNSLSVLDLSGSADEGSYWPTHRGNLYRTGALPSILTSAHADNVLPESLRLLANYPNPFNASTKINFEIATAGQVSLQILDIRGRVVETMVSEYMAPARYSVTWNGKLAGKPASAGIYFYRLSAATGTLIKKMTLLK